MSDSINNPADALRAKAERCIRLAWSMQGGDVRRRLVAMASDYLERALKLEEKQRGRDKKLQSVRRRGSVIAFTATRDPMPTPTIHSRWNISLSRQGKHLQLGRSMRRRQFIKHLAGALATWPVGAGAQQVRAVRIGILNFDNPEPLGALLRTGLRDLVYEEGRNAQLEYRTADGDRARLGPDGV
jgi:hypothetical protein